jgi:hypothetical protein
LRFTASPQRHIVQLSIALLLKKKLQQFKLIPYFTRGEPREENTVWKDFKRIPSSWCLGNRFIATVHFPSWIIHGYFIKKIFCKDANSVMKITLAYAVVYSSKSSESNRHVHFKDSVAQKLYLH